MKVTKEPLNLYLTKVSEKIGNNVKKEVEKKEYTNNKIKHFIGKYLDLYI